MAENILALLCNEMGTITEVLEDDFQTVPGIAPGDRLVDLFDPAIHDEVENFLDEVRSNGPVLHWRLLNPISHQIDGLHFSGCWDGNAILVIAVSSVEDLDSACKRLGFKDNDNLRVLCASLMARASLDSLRGNTHGDVSVKLIEMERAINTLQREYARKQAVLNDIESRFHLISENTVDVIWILDLALQRFLYVSPSVLRLRGYTPEEVMAAPVKAALTSSSYQYIMENLPKRLEAYKSGDRSALIQVDQIDQPHKNGSIIHTEVVSTLLPDREGQITQILGVTRDITERIGAENALRESEARYRLLVERMSDGLATINEKLCFTYVNDKFCEMVGYTREELIGKELSFIMTDEQLSIVRDELIERREGKTSTYEISLTRKDGETVFVLLSGAPVNHQDGSYRGSFGVFTDITQRKHVEEEIREREILLTNILDILPVGVWIADRSGRLTFGNPAGQRIWAGARFVGPEEFGEYKGWWFETGEPIAPHEWAVARAINKGETSIGELIEIEAFDGTRRLILNSALPMWGADQQITGAIVVNEDITERVRTDERIRLQSTALDFAANAIVITDREGTITWVNPAFTELTGYNPKEAIGGNPRMLKSNMQDVSFYRDLWGTILSGKVWRGEIVNRRKDGNLYTEEMTITPVQASVGKITHFIAIKQDITERKQIEQDLRHAKEAAEEAHQAEEERRQEAERRQRVAESLGDVISALNSNQTLEQVLDLIALQASQLLGSEGVAIYRLDDEQQEYQVQSSTGLSSEYAPEEAPSPAYKAMSQAVASGQPILVPFISTTITETPVVDVPGTTSALRKKYRALLALPILIGDETYGAMLLYYAAPHTFSDEDRDLALLYADQAALAVENARLRAEAGEIAVVRERSRLARDLHDAVTQTIYSATLVAEALPRVWERDPEEGMHNLHKLRQLVRGALAEMRTLLFELRPAALRTADLGELLMQLGDVLTGRTRIPVEVIVKGEAGIPEEVKIALYRITQEAFNNIEKHASANQVMISLDRTREHVSLVIVDDGHGFDATTVSGERMGLRIMHERAQGVAASLQVDSHPGRGTRIKVDWPLSGKG